MQSVPITIEVVSSNPAEARWFSLAIPVSSTNKTDRHNTAEILLKVALNTIKQTSQTINDDSSIDNIVSYMSSSISTIGRYHLLYVVMETTK